MSSMGSRFVNTPAPVRTDRNLMVWTYEDYGYRFEDVELYGVKFGSVPNTQSLERAT